MTALGTPLAVWIALTPLEAEPPRTVNDIELGSASEFTVEGPATVCMRNLVIRPKRGEKVQLAYSGIHWGTLKLFLEEGDIVEIREGDTFRDQRVPRRRPEWRQRGMAFYTVEEPDEATQYQIEGSDREGRWGRASRALVGSQGFKGKWTDRFMVKGLSFEKPGKVDCDRRFEYGWGVILGDEPLDSQDKNNRESEENQR